MSRPTTMAQRISLLVCLSGFAFFLTGAAHHGSSTATAPATTVTASPSSGGTKSTDHADTVKNRNADSLHSRPVNSVPARPAGVVSRPCATQEPLSAYAEELAKIVKFDRQVLLLVKEETHERIQRLVGYDNDGYQIVAPGIAVTVSEELSHSLLSALRRKLQPFGYLAFIVEMNALLKTEKIGVIKGPDPYEIIRIMHPDDEENGVSTDDIIERLKEWERMSSFTILGADNDWIELEFSALPADLKVFGEDIYDLSPDAVDEGSGTVDAMLRDLRKTNRLFLLWE